MREVKKERESNKTLLLFVWATKMNEIKRQIWQRRTQKSRNVCRQNINNDSEKKMSAITTTATFQPISQKMRLGSARRSSSVSSSFQRGHAAKITAAPMMKKVGVKLYRDLSQLFLNLKREEIFFPRLLKGPRAPGARVCTPLFYYPSWNAQISLRVSPL